MFISNNSIQNFFLNRCLMGKETKSNKNKITSCFVLSFSLFILFCKSFSYFYVRLLVNCKSSKRRN